MDDKMKLCLNNFYKKRQKLFWTAPDGPQIYYSKYSYANLARTLEKTSRTPRDVADNTVVHSLLNCSTRTVLYNLMFMSVARLLKLMKVVLSFIYSNNQNPQHAFRNVVSIYNCIYLVVDECGHHTMDKAQKISESNRIATYMQKHRLCPCVPTHDVNSFPNADYTLVLTEIPDNFYRDKD